MQDTRKRVGVRAAAAAVAANLAFAAVVAAAAAGPGYLDVEDWSATAQGTNGVRLSVTTDGSIPKQPDSFVGSNLIVGFAWVDAGTGTALVATIHPVIGRDSNQRPDSWHLHTVTLSLVDPDGELDRAGARGAPVGARRGRRVHARPDHARLAVAARPVPALDAEPVLLEQGAIEGGPRRPRPGADVELRAGLVERRDPARRIGAAEREARALARRRREAARERVGVHRARPAHGERSDAPAARRRSRAAGEHRDDERGRPDHGAQLRSMDQLRGSSNVPAVTRLRVTPSSTVKLELPLRRRLASPPRSRPSRSKTSTSVSTPGTVDE